MVGLLAGNVTAWTKLLIRSGVTLEIFSGLGQL